jgi:glycine betaine/proline transport system permease protein
LALNQLRIGQALELGICIVLIAVVLDRLSLAWANKATDYFADQGFAARHKYGLIFAGICVGGIVLAYIRGWILGDGINYFYLIPHNEGLTTEDFWQSGVDWMVDNWYQGLQGFNHALITQVLIPMKRPSLRCRYSPPLFWRWASDIALAGCARC